VQANLDTRRHLAKVEHDLAREFPALSAVTVRSKVERIATELLSSASFPDFVPLLTSRFARAELGRMTRSS
jgi:hypothetical protein